MGQCLMPMRRPEAVRAKAAMPSKTEKPYASEHLLLIDPALWINLLMI